jgi:hypothetical protein
MPDADFEREVVETSIRLIMESPHGQIEGVDVARELGREDDDTELYYAFQEAKNRGQLDIYFPGGMAMPGMIRRP